MKQLIKFARPVAAIAATIITTFTQPLMAANSKPHHIVAASATTENSFSMELNQQPNNEVVLLTIKNPGKKNLSVTLTGPDGYALNNFFIRKKIDQVDKTYNFSGADEGIYIIEVSDGIEKIKKQVKLERIPVPPVKLTVQ